MVMETESTARHSAAAEPVLASALVDVEGLEVVLARLAGDAGAGADTAPAPAPAATDTSTLLQTGIHSVDDVVGSLLQPSRVVALSSSSSLGASLARELVARFLVQREGAVAVLDATGGFDVVELFGGVLGGLGGRGEEERARTVLDRVRIMRVFDLEGVGEAVGEVGEGLEGGDEDGEGDVGVGEEPKRTVVADSEDEDDEEMLFDIEAAPAATNPPHDQKHTPPSPKTKLILLDNLAHVLTPLLKKNAPQGTPPPLPSFQIPTTTNPPSNNARNNPPPHPLAPNQNPQPLHPFAKPVHDSTSERPNATTPIAVLVPDRCPSAAGPVEQVRGCACSAERDGVAGGRCGEEDEEEGDGGCGGGDCGSVGGGEGGVGDVEGVG